MLCGVHIDIYSICSITLRCQRRMLEGGGRQLCALSSLLHTYHPQPTMNQKRHPSLSNQIPGHTKRIRYI